MKRINLKNGVLITFLLFPAFTFSGCNNARVSLLSMEPYDGKMPGGTFYFLKYFSERPGYRGLKVEIEVRNFGSLSSIYNKDAKEISAELVKYAKLQNVNTTYSEVQYYYNYWGKVFQPKQRCKLTLYYLIPPAEANASLRFVYDYTTSEGKHLHIDSPCKIFK